MAELKSSVGIQIIDVRKQVELDLIQMRQIFDEFKQSNLQLKTQVRNQVHHHTEFAKQITLHQQ